MEFDGLSRLLIDILRMPPAEGGVRNAIQHMWGHVSSFGGGDIAHVNSWSLRRLLHNTQLNTMAAEEPYAMKSTALSELMVWL